MFSIASVAMVRCTVGIMKNTLPSGMLRAWTLPTGAHMNFVLLVGDPFLRDSRLG